jgi:hypothetical protein
VALPPLFGIGPDHQDAGVARQEGLDEPDVGGGDRLSMPQSVWWMTTNSRVPSSQLEIMSDRSASSVARPPALRTTCAPISSPRNFAG